MLQNITERRLNEIAADYSFERPTSIEPNSVFQWEVTNIGGPKIWREGVQFRQHCKAPIATYTVDDQATWQVSAALHGQKQCAAQAA